MTISGETVMEALRKVEKSNGILGEAVPVNLNAVRESVDGGRTQHINLLGAAAAQGQNARHFRKIIDALPAAPQWSEPDWEQVAPGIECKLLATDTERQRVSMLVRLAPGASYPAHTHAGVEELHLLDGELWIDERKLFPGDYNYGAPGAGDERVWSETGCTCVLVTSTKDVLI